MATGCARMSDEIVFSRVDKTHFRPQTGQAETVLHDFSLEVGAGELVAIVGPSGIGKTTLLHLTAGLESPDSGTVHVGSGSSAPRVGMVFQQPRLLDWLSVQANVTLAADAAGVSREHGRRMLQEVNLAGYEEAYPLSLSGGQRQRVALARAFAIEPDIVLLDEPFSALDELTARRLRSLLQELWLLHGPTGLLVTHSTLEAAFLADRVIVLGGRPTRILRTIDVPSPRPRASEDPALFEHHREIINAMVDF